MTPPAPRLRRIWTPRHWASLVPFGLGEQAPNNFAEPLRAAWENRDQLGRAWRILNEGVCDGCALGTSGMTDWTLPGIHLCNIRLRLLRLNTMPPFDPALAADADSLRRLSGARLRELGRLPVPMIRRRGERGFRPLSWSEAMAEIAGRIRAAGPDRTAFHLTSRGIPNEVYYAAQKAARAIGTNNVDNAARLCHAPSTVALKEAIGAAASTCSYADWIESDLLVFAGSNPAVNQPVAVKYLHFAKKNGAQIVCVNTFREPGMERYWIPSLPESALFGTRIADRFHMPRPGGDAAFFTGALKRLAEMKATDEAFLAEHCEGWPETRAAIEALSWAEIEAAAGVPRSEIDAFAESAARAERGILVWSMGITQRRGGEDAVRAIANLALARGWIGRPGCGLVPIRGHSGVQGGAEMGCYATAFPGGVPVNEENAARLSEAWGFPVPARPGLSAPEMIDAAAAGRLDVLFAVGGNFLDTLPDPAAVEAALARLPLRVHMDIILSSQMLAEPGETVILLPAATRYEVPGGVTETSTERRVIFSPEIPGGRPPEARSELHVLRDLARLVRPDLAFAFDWGGELPEAAAPAIREEIARIVPFYAGIEKLKRKGDQFQYGGRLLCEGGRFPTPSGRARLRPVPVEPPPPPRPPDRFHLSTRRGKQFNAMIHDDLDAVTGASRDSIFMNSADARRLGLNRGDRIELFNETGRMEGRVFPAILREGHIQAHWPEANVLLPGGLRSPESGVPDYNAEATVRKLG